MSHPNQIQLESRNYIRDFARSVSPVPWSVQFLKLAWTAGPVTYLALQGGSLLGFGETASWNTFMYFSGYTTIMGLIAISAHLLSLVYKHKFQIEKEQQLSLTLARLPELIFAVEDLEQHNLSEEQRTQKLASRILANPSASESSIFHAIRMSLNDKEIANLAQKLEVLRKIGAVSGIQDSIHANQECIDRALKQCEKLDPEFKELIHKRLQGVSPSLKRGIQRPPGFLLRILTGGEYQDLKQFSLSDACHLFILCLELLHGRKIPMIHFRYKGARNLNQAVIKIEENRSRLRASKVQFLNQTNHLKKIAIQLQWLDPAENSTRPSQFFQLLKARFKERNSKKSLDTAQIRGVWTRLLNARKKIELHTAQLEDSMKRWQKALQNYAVEFEFQFDGDKPGKGLTIFEQEIYLKDEEKLALVESTLPFLSNLLLRRTTGRLLVEDEGEFNPLTEESIKEYAIEIYLALHEVIPLEQPSIRYAIESANAANFYLVEMGISDQATNNWAHAAVLEVEKDMGKAAEKLAEVLVTHYGEALDHESLKLLNTHYGSDYSKLLEICNMHQDSSPQQALIDQSWFPSLPKFEQFFVI